LAGSLVPTTIVGHPFWAAETTAERRNQEVHFAKNLGLLGGLLLAAADTQGRPSLRWRASHAVDRTQRSVRRVARTARRETRIAALAAGTARRLPGR
jgi:putative oxidoreductase